MGKVAWKRRGSRPPWLAKIIFLRSAVKRVGRSALSMSIAIGPEYKTCPFVFVPTAVSVRLPKGILAGIFNES